MSRKEASQKCYNIRRLPNPLRIGNKFKRLKDELIYEVISFQSCREIKWLSAIPYPVTQKDGILLYAGVQGPNFYLPEGYEAING